MSDKEAPELLLDDTEEICKEIMDLYPQYVRLHQQGGDAIRFLVGKVMAESGGSCNPKNVATTLKRMIEEDKTNGKEIE